MNRLKSYLIAIALLHTSGCNITTSPDSSSSTAPGAGFSARDYLTASTYQSLIIEIQYVTGYAPTTAAQNALVTFLQARLNKPGGITIQLDPALSSPGKSTYSLDDARSIEAVNRKHFANGSTAVAYFLFLDGDFAGNSGSSQVLGVTYGPSSIVMMGKTLLALSGSVGQPSTNVLETTVMEHEFGHLLGLVNTGTAPTTNHQDTPHGAHCSNSSCLMYWAVDTSDFIANLLGGSVPTLDADCVHDLQVNGGK